MEKLDRGREQFSVAVDIFSGDSDIVKFYRGDTYVRWGMLEREWGFNDSADQLFESARAEFASQQNPFARERNMRRVTNVLQPSILVAQPEDERDSNLHNKIP